jgi:hypothetical protein
MSQPIITQIAVMAGSGSKPASLFALDQNGLVWRLVVDGTNTIWRPLPLLPAD